MTRDEASRLVSRIEATWADGRWSEARRAEWADDL
jgi:hypothetical protein